MGKPIDGTIDDYMRFAQARGEGVDYASRKRNLEWRRNWFYLNRSEDDDTFADILRRGLDHKRKIIEKQRRIADHMAAYAPAGAGSPWFTIGPRNVNGRVKCLAVDPTNPDILYAGAASGGVWKSSDGGQSWRPLWDEQDTMAIGAIAVAPSNPNIIYAATGEWTPGWSPSFPGTGLFASTDGGATWTQHTTLTSKRVAKVVVSSTDANRLFVAGASGFERSTDGGATWTTVRAGQISDAVIDPGDPDVLYINVTSDGIYKTTDGGATWTKLTNAPSGAAADWIRLAIGVGGASGSNLIVAKRSGTLYRSTDGGVTWTTLAGTHGDASYHSWCNLLAVARDNDDVILAGGVDLQRTANGGTTWTSPAGLHTDHHRAVFAPSNPDVVYSCNDGGVYRSDDQGATWIKASHGLIVTQFYDIGAWSQIGTVAGGGSQDNGTNMTTGGLTWSNIFGWDGGYFVLHPSDPRTIYAEHQNTDIHKSTDGGNTWVQKTSGLSGGTPWVGVITMDPNAPNTLFVGTNQVFRTTDGCATAWVASSQTLTGSVTSITIAESDSNRVYAATTSGKVYRSDDNGATSPWTDKSSGLPTRSVTDVVVRHTDRDRVAISFGGVSSGPGAASVFLSADGATTWTDISGDLPKVPVSALAFDPVALETLYAGTDVGVFRTADGGATWLAFDNGMPNVIVTDLYVDRTASLLIAATMGRGMYKVSISGAAEANVDLYLRDSLLDTGERLPSPSNQPNPNDLSDQVYWWESPDIKVDTTPYFTPDPVFDGVEFDELQHEDPKRTEVNRFYLQLHNRGWQNATNVCVRAFLADASAGLPALPNALTPPDFNLTSTADWTPIGPVQNVALLEPNRPVIASWDYTVLSTAATHSCLLAVISSAEDPITTPETNVDLLIKNEKRVCLKNLHVINGGPAPQQTMAAINFHNVRDRDDLIDVVIAPVEFSEGTIGILLPKISFVEAGKALDGVQVYALHEGEDFGTFYVRPGTKADVDWQGMLQKVDVSRIFEFDAQRTSALRGIRIPKGGTLQGILTFRGSRRVPYGQTQQFTVIQMQGGEMVGGSTYELRLRRAKGLHPVSHIRVILEKVRIVDDHDPWFKGAGEFHFTTVVSFNDDECRRHFRRIPQKGRLKIHDKAGRNEREINECIFDGYVAESDRMEISILPIEEDWLDPDDPLSRYRRTFDGPPEMWLGRYTPGDESSTKDPEMLKDWYVWYRVESVRL
jgi:photosystem II stability/assembly factor-like uncharacterized protein